VLTTPATCGLSQVLYELTTHLLMTKWRDARSRHSRVWHPANIGRALRRQSYEQNEEGLFNVDYADVFGVTAKPVVVPPQPPRETVQVKAIFPDRDAPP
jgi:hypothetical protein